MKKQVLSIVLCVFGLTVTQAQDQSKETVLFAYNDYNINPDAHNQLDHFVANLNQENIKSIQVIGHTDSDGSDEYNKKLSLNRANSVKELLAKKGLPSKLIEMDYKGEELPTMSNSNLDGMQANRRVEIIVEYFDEFKIPTFFLVEPTVYRVSPLKDTTILVGDKGTQLIISKHSFLNKNGSTIQDTVEILFTEYTNPAEIAFSGIPMTYDDNGEEKVMSSNGMFVIEGKLNGEEIKLQKSITIDYAMIENKPDVNFYKLEKKGWVEKHSLAQRIVYKDGQDSLLPYVSPPQYIWNLKIPKENYPKLVEKALIREEIWNQKWTEKFDEISEINWNWRRKRKLTKAEKKKNSEHFRMQRRGLFVYYPSPENTNSWYKENVDLPPIAQGLNIESFGKYNCDQIFRLPNATKVIASFVDENGQPIKDPIYLSMVDPKYNGAFSFSPGEFTCNRKAKNVLALFNREGKIYICDKTAFSSLNIKGNGKYTIWVKYVSKKIKSQKDLAKYLGINTKKKSKS